MGATGSLLLPALLLSVSGLSVASSAPFNLQRRFVSARSRLAMTPSAPRLANCHFHSIGEPVEIIRHQHSARFQSVNSRSVAIGYFHDLAYICAPSPFQYGSVAGLVELPDSFYGALATEYQAKRDMLCSALQDAGFKPSVPQGAYYVLADVSRVPGATAREKARNLLAQSGVAGVAGTAFFTGGRGEEIMRFCFAKRDDDLQRACDALRNYRI